MPSNDAMTAKGILTAVPDQSEAFFIPSHGEQWRWGRREFLCAPHSFPSLYLSYIQATAAKLSPLSKPGQNKPLGFIKAIKAHVPGHLIRARPTKMESGNKMQGTKDNST